MRKQFFQGTDYLFVDDIDILSDLINDEEKINLYKSIHRLDEIQREIILQRLVGLSFKEIGNIWGKSDNWARVNYYRAKEQLVKRIGDDSV